MSTHHCSWTRGQLQLSNSKWGRDLGSGAGSLRLRFVGEIAESSGYWMMGEEAQVRLAIRLWAFV